MNKPQPVRKAVIPVAGFGTRFLPAAKAMPKEMLPVVDKPIIQYIVEEAVAAGFTEIIFVTGRNKRAVEDHFDTSYELECLLEEKGKQEILSDMRRISDLVRIVYVRQKKALGLGHAILQAKQVVGDEPFAIFLGDDIIDSKRPAIQQMLDVYQEYGKSVIAVRRAPRDQLSNYGVIKPEKITERVSKVMELVEKPEPDKAPSDLAITGRYVLDHKIFSYIEDTKPGAGGEIQITDALTKLASNDGLLAYEYEGTYYDGGNKLELLKAQVDFALKRPEFKKEFAQFLKDKVS